MLAALLRCASGAPVEDSPTDSPAGDSSGEEGETESPSDTLTVVLESILGATKRHKKEVRAFIFLGLLLSVKVGRCLNF